MHGEGKSCTNSKREACNNDGIEAYNNDKKPPQQGWGRERGLSLSFTTVKSFNPSIISLSTTKNCDQSKSISITDMVGHIL